MNIGPKFIKVTPDNPAQEAIEEAVAVIKTGGTIAYPTRCLYGLGVDAFDAGAVARLYSIKHRSPQKPILVLIDHIKWLERLVIRVPETATVIMAQFWPGKVTLVFEASDTVSSELTGGSGKIGIRQPGHPVASALVKLMGSPITGTSANLSGSQGCRQICDLEPDLAGNLELILDAGPLQGGRGSTVVDVTTKDKPIILREGAITQNDIMAAVGG